MSLLAGIQRRKVFTAQLIPVSKVGLPGPVTTA
jgi:hypothetical protein